ncbi:MAG: hypothetical protein ACK2UI_15955 [Anaerolineae bacterium]
MGLSYREQLVVAMRELLPGRFFRRWQSMAAQNGRHNGWRGRGS